MSNFIAVDWTPTGGHGPELARKPRKESLEIVQGALAVLEYTLLDLHHIWQRDLQALVNYGLIDVRDAGKLDLTQDLGC